MLAPGGPNPVGIASVANPNALLDLFGVLLRDEFPVALLEPVEAPFPFPFPFAVELAAAVAAEALGTAKENQGGLDPLLETDPAFWSVLESESEKMREIGQEKNSCGQSKQN